MLAFAVPSNSLINQYKDFVLVWDYMSWIRAGQRTTSLPASDCLRASKWCLEGERSDGNMSWGKKEGKK